MLRIKEELKQEFVEKYGFKKCKKPYDGVYYLCLAHNPTIIFVGYKTMWFEKWGEDNPRIHKHPKCKYRDRRDMFDILYDAILDGYVEKTVY